jgi:hypothetical protein
MQEEESEEFHAGRLWSSQDIQHGNRTTQFDVLCRTAFIVLRVSNYSSQQLSCRFVAASNKEIDVPNVFFLNIQIILLR